MATPDRLDLPTDARGRLLAGLAATIVQKGYAAATIADVVARARVSKRTFYEHFADKEACFLALYAAAGDHMLELIARAADGDGPWRVRLDAATRAYLAALAAQPALTRTFLIEIQAAGERALAARRTVLARFAAQLRTLTEEAARDDPALTALSAPMAMTLVGGINELLLEAVEDGRTEHLAELADTAGALLIAVVAAPRVQRHSRNSTNGR